MEEQRDPVVRQYARGARDYDRRWSSYVRATTRETLARVQLHPGGRLLDIGCGTGALLEALAARYPQCAFAGVDSTPEMLAVARERLPEAVDLRAAHAERLPFAEAAFDAVVSCNMFHYLREPKAALAEFRRVLKPGGRLIITDWCDDYLACKVCHLFLSVFDPAHWTVYGTTRCRNLLEESGFSGIRVEAYRISWLWGMMTAVAVNESM